MLDIVFKIQALDSAQVNEDERVIYLSIIILAVQYSVTKLQFEACCMCRYQC